MSGKLADALINTQNIISTMPSALFVVNRKGSIIQTNKKAEELLKSTKAKLKGKNFFDLFRAVSNRKALKVSDLTPRMKITDLPGKLGTSEHTEIPVSLSGIAIKEKNKTNGRYFILTAADLREQKRYARSRVNKITPILNRISLGYFDAKLEHPKSNDEFSDLIVAINLMTDNLKGLIEENRRKTDQLIKSHTVLQKAKTATDREKAKAEALLSHIGEAVIAINMEGKVIFINPQAETAFGHRSFSVIGKPYTKPYHFELENGQKMTPDKNPVSTCIKKRKPIHFISYFISKQKKRIPFSTTVSPKNLFTSSLILFQNKKNAFRFPLPYRPL
jgi:PAS domain S-box-containing protein